MCARPVGSLMSRLLSDRLRLAHILRAFINESLTSDELVTSDAADQLEDAMNNYSATADRTTRKPHVLVGDRSLRDPASKEGWRSDCQRHEGMPWAIVRQARDPKVHRRLCCADRIASMTHRDEPLVTIASFP